MASAHAFQEHILSGKEAVAVHFFQLAKVRAEVLHSSLKTHYFSSLNVAVWRPGKLELFI